MFSIHFYHLMNISGYINMEKAFNEFAIDWDNQLEEEREVVSVCMCVWERESVVVYRGGWIKLRDERTGGFFI